MKGLRPLHASQEFKRDFFDNLGAVISQLLFAADGGPSACQSQIDANSKRTQPCPRGSGQRSWTQGLAKPDQGGKQEANGGKLAFIRAVQAFTCHGGAAVPLSSFISLAFTSHAAFFGTFLGSKKVPFSSFPSFPSSPYRRFLRLYLAICFIFSCLAASCAARSDSAVSA